MSIMDLFQNTFSINLSKIIGLQNKYAAVTNGNNHGATQCVVPVTNNRILIL